MKLKLIALSNNVTKITVKSNLPHNKGQLVQLTIKEISEFTPKEAKIIIKLLNDWLSDAGEMAHDSSIKAYLAKLRKKPLPDGYYFNKVYFAISTPEVNGTNQIRIESFVEFEKSPKVTAVSCWENVPHNRDTLNDSRHFLGVGRQLLWSAIQKEATAMTSGEFIFYIGAIDVMKKEGVEIKDLKEGFRSKPYTKEEILAKAQSAIR